MPFFSFGSWHDVGETLIRLRVKQGLNAHVKSEIAPLENMRIDSATMARPLTGTRKRVRFNTTFDPDVLARARACASAQNLTLPQLVERLLLVEIKREAALLRVMEPTGAGRVSENRKSRRAKGN